MQIREHAEANPDKAAVIMHPSGTAVTFKNTSKVSHTIAARDGSWSTGVIQPGASGSATITKPGSYEYTCTQHPWTIGQLIVE